MAHVPAHGQTSPEFRPDETPWIWIDLGNRAAGGAAVGFAIDERHVWTLEFGYLADLLEERLAYAATSLAYEPADEDWFVELEFDVGVTFNEESNSGQVEWVALGRAVWTPHAGRRTHAFWFDIGWTTEPGALLLTGYDVPVVPREGGLLIGLHLFGRASIVTDDLAPAVGAIAAASGLRLAWRNGPKGISKSRSPYTSSGDGNVLLDSFPIRQSSDCSHCACSPASEWSCSHCACSPASEWKRRAPNYVRPCFVCDAVPP